MSARRELPLPLDEGLPLLFFFLTKWLEPQSLDSLF